MTLADANAAPAFKYAGDCYYFNYTDATITDLTGLTLLALASVTVFTGCFDCSEGGICIACLTADGTSGCCFSSGSLLTFPTFDLPAISFSIPGDANPAGFSQLVYDAIRTLAATGGLSVAIVNTGFFADFLWYSTWGVYPLTIPGYPGTYNVFIQIVKQCAGVRWLDLRISVFNPGEIPLAGAQCLAIFMQPGGTIGGGGPIGGDCFGFDMPDGVPARGQPPWNDTNDGSFQLSDVRGEYVNITGTPATVHAVVTGNTCCRNAGTPPTCQHGTSDSLGACT